MEKILPASDDAKSGTSITSQEYLQTDVLLGSPTRSERNYLF